MTPQIVQSEPPREAQAGLQNISRPYPPAVNPAGAHPAAVPRQRSLRVLCIDDDEQILESLKDCLAHFQHQVKTASGGKYGIELFCTSILKSEPYDVVVVDLCMPDLNGCDVARKIKTESPGTPIVIMTGEDSAAKETGLISRSANAVIYKPVHMQELNNLLLRVAKPA
jgi:DNA-binding response OmpR family regulator